MRDGIFHLDRRPNISIQGQIREMLVSAILGRQLPAGDPLPSSRKLAKSLGVSRNTVVLAYQGLVDDGYLESRERSGFYVTDDILEGRADDPVVPPPVPDARTATGGADWAARFRVRPSHQANIEKPGNWLTFPYPFIYGQVDQSLFPIAQWRECSRQALGRKGMDAWTGDALAADDPMLVEQIQTRLLPRRGILARDDEILVTLGAQNALYILAALLVRADTRVAIEDPGYPDVRNIFGLKTDRIEAIPVDRHGMPVDERLDRCELVFVTPSHQAPTTVTMPKARRQDLLARARDEDFVIIEDDYEWETNYVSEPTPALKSMDTAGRVIYVGSLSKTLFPGLRLGYLVGPAPLIKEARALRRLMLRHAPNNNQRTAALFLALGHHDSLVHKLQKAYRERWRIMGRALADHLPGWSKAPAFGGTSYWVSGPEGFDAGKLADRALDDGVIIEPGRVNFFARTEAPRNHFRLGFSSIAAERIEPGIRLLADIVKRDI
ncbi:MAG: 2-aminoadipate aminotransferase [Rhodospirillales bacterium CG15_BIG_FIL_POST_REV_8_21_14_020_66_15]|nr:MAG: 2-aminoadipate aminotransferase [Rhodospirillales bacterium CG15_BIG_FIL_POST_REV_8_21_14_020_66_15]